MGQKVHPNGFRFGIYRPNLVKWYAEKADFGRLLVEDQLIYNYFDKLVRRYQIGKIGIERVADRIVVTLRLARIGSFRGQNGEPIKRHILALQKLIKRRDAKIQIELVELVRPELNARLVAETIAEKLENRLPFRLAQRQVIRAALRAGAKGIKTVVSGRLGGVDMARTEGYTEGEMHLHTLRQKIDYATALGRTTYGIIGVKVWLSFGEILRKPSNKEQAREREQRVLATTEEQLPERGRGESEPTTNQSLREDR